METLEMETATIPAIKRNGARKLPRIGKIIGKSFSRIGASSKT